MFVHSLKIALLCVLSCNEFAEGTKIDELQDTISRARREIYSKPPSKCILGQDLPENIKKTESDCLCFGTSEKHPHQIVFLNVTFNAGIVVDTVHERTAIFNGKTGECIILDQIRMTGIHIVGGTWNAGNLYNYALDTDLEQLYDDHSQSEFNISQVNGPVKKPILSFLGNLFGKEQDDDGKDDTKTKVNDFLLDVLPHFGNDFWTEVLEIKEDLAAGLIRLFRGIIYPIKYVLKGIIDVVTGGLIFLEKGLHAVIKIIETLGEFVMSIPDGIKKLIAAGVKFSLASILLAIDGASAFYYVLKELSKFFNLADILKGILTAPLKVAKLIAGFGGMAVQGVTGIFHILYQIFETVAGGITSMVKGGFKLISNIILLFFGARNYTKREELNASIDLIFLVLNEQQQKYNNKQDLEQFEKFLQTLEGKNAEYVMGIDVGSLVGTLTSPANASGLQLATQALKIAIPNQLNISIPYLFLNTVKLLDTSEGPTYIERLIPDINKTTAESRSKINLRTSPPLQILVEKPFVENIYNKLERASQEHLNSSLEKLLNNEPDIIDELTLLTTRASEFPKE